MTVMPRKYSQNEPLLIEKIIASLSYISAGAVGFIWLLFAFFTKNNLKPFLKYHIFQSIFISFTLLVVNLFFGLIMNILSFIPLVGQLIMNITFYFNAPLLFGLSLIELFITMVVFYLVFTCLQGQYSYLPWISEIIKANVRNS